MPQEDTHQGSEQVRKALLEKPAVTPAESSVETPEDRAARAAARLKASKQAAAERATATAEYEAIGDARRAKSSTLKQLRMLRDAKNRAAAKADAESQAK